MNYTIMCTVKEIGLTNEGKVRCELAPISKYRLKVENKELYVAINSGSCEVLVVDPKNLQGEVFGDIGGVLVALYGSGREVSITVGADGKVSWLRPLCINNQDDSEGKGNESKKLKQVQ